MYNNSLYKLYKSINEDLILLNFSYITFNF